MLQNIKPLDLSDPRKAMVSSHAYLRQLIYDNVLPAGMAFSQVELANALGVSRTPLREALRMLQEEGLVVSEVNRRCRIAGFSPEDLDAVYGSRLLLEALAMRITLPKLTADDLAEMENLLRKMDELNKTRQNDSAANDEWRGLHRAFHFKMIGKAPEQLVEQIRIQVTRCERYLIGMTNTRTPDPALRQREHRNLLERIRTRNFEKAVSEMAQHRARTAIALLAEATVDFEPVVIRGALRLILVENTADTGA